MEEKNKKEIVTRFAPSPTGFLHIGGVRTAIYAWLWARKNNGKFILRIEDTDKEREVAGSIEHIIKSLKWVGLDWDYGPDKEGPTGSYIQSKRLDRYKKYADELVLKGFAYADPFTEEEVESFRKKAEEEKRPFLFRDHRPANPPAWDGTMPLRLRVANIKNSEWKDVTRGDLKAGEEALDDFILIKSDGYPTYNFAHIIDDYEMGVTHIMRADEFIASTPKFLALYEALGIERPEFVTLPPILGKDGKKKLGKRDGAKDFLEYSKDGYLPEAMLNFLTFIGWNPGDNREIMSKEELITAFDVNQIQVSGGMFNEEKLDWINHEHLKRLSEKEQQDYVISFIPERISKLENYSEEIVRKITPIIIERIKKGKDIEELGENKDLDFYFTEPIYEKDGLFFKSSKIENDKYNTLANYLEKTIEILGKIDDSEFK
ncbi:MAG: glutamate--tRNA ligase, partial [Candidatus Moranbacteria bacterium]|nr:glutamate--tRNA ligase [Candidatus Moranbacteria bacterium]